MVALCSCGLAESHRHLGVVEMRGEVLRLIFFPGESGIWHRVVEGLPVDAKLLVAYFAPERMVYCFVYESPSFPVCLEGAEVGHFVVVVHGQRSIPVAVG